LLPKTSYGETELITKHIYHEIEKASLNDIIISVSIGWDTKSSPDQSMMEVYAKAEECMYRKKLTESQSMRSKTIQVIMKTLNETNKRERIHS
ncbi:MAG: PAS domain S-box protein, partial [Clostridiales bacterium]|nr:PAS domain S-box protein [Clostridiales bacterium]